MKTLKQLRLDRDLSPEQVAVSLKVSCSCVHDWESGRSSPQAMNFKNAMGLAKTYKIGIDELAEVIFPENDE